MLMKVKSISYSPKALKQLKRNEKRFRARQLREERKQNIDYSNKKYGNFGVFGVIILVLAIIVTARVLTGSSVEFSFKSLLDFASTAPSISANWSIVQNLIVGDWGLFEFLRNFINFSWSIFTVLICLCDLLFDSLAYIFYFVRGLFFP